MAKVSKERLTAVAEGDFVLFLIGMRINNWFAIRRWWPVFAAMPKMLKELHINRDLGFSAADRAESVGNSPREPVLAFVKRMKSTHPSLALVVLASTPDEVLSTFLGAFPATAIIAFEPDWRDQAEQQVSADESCEELFEHEA